MALRPCLDCGALSNQNRCLEHRRAREAARGTTAERGYGSQHQAERQRWLPLVKAGRVNCWRCGERIEPGDEFDLGHDDYDRRITRGPEHARRCNRAAAGGFHS